MALHKGCRFVFVVGGVASSLGKGIVVASLGKLFQAQGLAVTAIKMDPYLNLDAGTLSPHEHGECYVTDDGGETDLDLGHYERFLGKPLGKANCVTAGQVYNAVMGRERRGDFLGETVQVVPHVTSAINQRIRALAAAVDVVIVEFGGTVGDMEAVPFLEALRTFRGGAQPHETALVLLTLVPYIRAAQELKTKPTQQTVKVLRESGNRPDVIVCRTERALSAKIKEKIAFFCNVDVGSVIEDIDTDVVYEVPLLLRQEGFDAAVDAKLRLGRGDGGPGLAAWEKVVGDIRRARACAPVRIGLVGKYSQIPDTYRSIREALVHAGAAARRRVDVVALSAGSGLAAADFADLDGILVAPGFGARGVEDKIRAAGHARTQRLPFFGICLGLQCAVVEFARNVLGLAGAASTEVAPDAADPVICLLDGQRADGPKGGTMRLGRYACTLRAGATKARRAYVGECQAPEGSTTVVSERHRHRYEFNAPAYAARFAAAGMAVTGSNPELGLAEIMEILDHPWFVGVQFHPEYKSYVERPHPLFVAFVQAAAAQSNLGRR
uniref:CTP synthase (glutamine hydrolyzing) n=1 Tax=Marseillevirus LCMAC103 TaxID=2506604 RepID=A0A481YUL3_9VIRU|nr:MAG: uncharacterized protein LCMAC103_02100 [Marseillevirus LCMAC103]